MREISVQAMLEGTAKNRIERAMNTKTLIAGEAHDYKIGELVDFFRTQSTKDVSGWKGPAKIIDNTNISRGTVTVRRETFLLRYVCRMSGDI